MDTNNKIPNGWIPVNEKPPAPGQKVIGLFFSGITPVIMIVNWPDGTYGVKAESMIISPIDFWIPLPILPEVH